MQKNRLKRWMGGAFCLAVLVVIACQPAQADEPKPKIVVVGLENPSGVAIHAGTGDVFVASEVGVYRYKPAEKDREKKIHLEIINSLWNTTSDVYGKGPMYTIGPLGVAFMDNDQLVVGDGSRKDGDEFVRVYKIDAEDKQHEPIKEESAAFTLGPIKAGDQSAMGEGNFYGVAVGAGAIWATCNGDDTKGWIAKSVIADGKPGALTPAIATKVATNVDAPVPIVFSPDGKDLIVGQMGEVAAPPGDSLLCVYDPATGMLKKSYKTGLNDLAGLAYNPKNGKLYGTDFSWSDTSKGGLFELTIEGEEVKPKKILGLDKPTAIAFDKDGKLYVAVFGSLKDTDVKDPKDPKYMSPGTLQLIEAVP